MTLSDEITEFLVLSRKLSHIEFICAISILTFIPLMYKIIVGIIVLSNLLSFLIHRFPLLDTTNTRLSVMSRIPLRTLEWFIEWFSKRKGTSFQNGARSKNAKKKLGRERRRVVLKSDLAVVSTNCPRYICS